MNDTEKDFEEKPKRKRLSQLGELFMLAGMLEHFLEDSGEYDEPIEEDWDEKYGF